MKLVVVFVFILFSSINCDKENFKKLQDDLKFAETYYTVAKNAEKSAKEAYEEAQSYHEQIESDIIFLKDRLDSNLNEQIKANEARTIAFQEKDKALAAAVKTEENFKAIKEELAAAKTIGDQQKIDTTTKEYVKASAGQIITAQKLKEAEDALNKAIAASKDANNAVEPARKLYENALNEKKGLSQKLAKLKVDYETKMKELTNFEKGYKRAESAQTKEENKKNTARTFGSKQMFELFCSLLTGAVAILLIL